MCIHFSPVFVFFVNFMWCIFLLVAVSYLCKLMVYSTVED
jgi:hypothetical protein